ncbi:GDP-mannose:glycolipid 4-beta-D-mannosyltransferase [Microbacterium lemovicicum]|uniref:GDP-mannose:glycolipid 4-beta-D-mannosyltransferase n=2 Tax=Microbacterium lemovicicum TaxID=1072463 RepID=A0A3S9W6F4_9MICO|nr:GDP-mannose:glycolipid 4-beta-D-mannosyltransferase [Microbacterium lemovicicum]
MVSFSATNRDPLTTVLFDALSEHMDIRHFTWRFAILGHYDVLNMHWPDHLTKRHGRLQTWVRWMLYLLLMMRVRWGRPVLVRTLHNLAPHEGRRGVELGLLRLTDRWTDTFITMQPDPPLSTRAPIVFIPQGHYRDVYQKMPRREALAKRLLFFGIVRAYKGVPELLDAFAESEDDEMSLRIAGRVLDAEVGSAVRAAAAKDQRVSLHLDWVTHDALAEEIQLSEMVVLPYREIFNSGTVIVALSLDRPVLVPEDQTTARLRDEVGPGWVFLFQPPLTGRDIEVALASHRLSRPSDPPNLSAREWSEIASAYARTFEEAIHANSNS